MCGFRPSTPPRKPRLRFSRAQRISRGADIQRIQQEGKVVRTRHFSIRACASPLGFPRVGLIVPRHGKSAVDRNRLKRRLREIIRQDVLPSDRGLDIIVRTAPGAYAVPFADLRVEVNGVLGRLMS